MEASYSEEAGVERCETESQPPSRSIPSQIYGRMRLESEWLVGQLTTPPKPSQPLAIKESGGASETGRQDEGSVQHATREPSFRSRLYRIAFWLGLTLSVVVVLLLVSRVPDLVNFAVSQCKTFVTDAKTRSKEELRKRLPRFPVEFGMVPSGTSVM